MKVLWVSDLGVSTGFARVSHSIIKHLKKDMDITGFGINYKGVPHSVGIDIYPAGAGVQDPMGFSRLVDFIKATDYDLIFMLQDVWVLNQYLHQIKEGIDKNKIPPIVIYFPVDAEEHDKNWYKNFDIVSEAVVYTEFGNTVAIEASGRDNFTIIPHGNDSSVFYKKFESRKEAKKLLVGGKKMPEFLVLSANRNQPRKRLDLVMRGFKLFAEDKEDVFLHMHCGVLDASINVAELGTRLGIDAKVILTNNKAGPQSVSEEDLNLFYNAADVGINTGMGEGWGLTATEHAMTGAVQILPDHSACRELFQDVGILIPTVCDFTFDGVMTLGKLVSPEGVANALQFAYDNREDTSLADAAMTKFSDIYYDWEDIARRWKDIFREVAK